MARMSAEERRDQLVAAAIALMTREGVAAATTRAIAAEADMPLGVFHYAFRSKQELLSRVTEAIAQQSKADIDAAVLAAESRDVYQLLLAGLSAYFDHVKAHPLEHLVTYEVTTTALRDPELEEAARRQYEYYLEENRLLLEAVAELLGIEYIADVSVVSRFAFSLMDGLALNYLAKGDEEEARAVIELAARTVHFMVKQQ